jgi:hypothetical protein
MRSHRWEVLARLEDGMSERPLDGSALGLVTVCLSDDGAGEISDQHGRPVEPAPAVGSHLRPAQAPALAFELLAPAEVAERRFEERR